MRQNPSAYLRRVGCGERLIVTDRNRPAAELGPPASSGAALDRLIAAGLFYADASALAKLSATGPGARPCAPASPAPTWSPASSS